MNNDSIFFIGFTIILLIVAVVTIVIVANNERDDLCQQCGYNKATDFEITGTQIECDNTKIIIYKIEHNIDKWGKEQLSGRKVPMCNAMENITNRIIQ